MNKKQSTQFKNPLNFQRITLAFRNSFDGLKHAIRNETAFQQELIVLIVMTIVATFSPFTLALKVAIVISHLFILVVELLNSAIEAIVDKVSPEYHILAKQSKDMASAAVLVSFLISIIIWVYAIYQVITSL